MKTKLGILGTLICSAGLVALPAMAQSRGSYGSHDSQNSSQHYTSNAPVYNQAQPSQSYAQVYTGNSRVYNQSQAYGQRFTGDSHAYTSGYSRSEYRSDDRHDRYDRDHDRRGRDHDRDDRRDGR